MASRPAPPRTSAQAHRDLGAKLKAQIASGQITNAQANAMLREQSPALQEVRAIQAKRQAAAALPEMNKALQEYRGQQQQGSSGGNLLGALRPGVTSPTPMPSPGMTPQVSRLPGMTAPSMGGVKPGFQNPPSMQLTPPKSSAPYMPSATAPTGPAPAGPPTTPGAAMRMKKGGKVSKPVKKMAKGGSTASSRGDGCAVRGKTKGMMR